MYVNLAIMQVTRVWLATSRVMIGGKYLGVTQGMNGCVGYIHIIEGIGLYNISVNLHCILKKSVSKSAWFTGLDWLVTPYISWWFSRVTENRQ